MEELDILKRVGRVAAPAGFERRVMLELARRKESGRAAPARRPALWLAAASTAVLAVALLVNVFVLRRNAPAGLAAGEAEAIAVMEPLDYRQEARSLSEEPGTVYLLENVSDTTYQDIRY